MVDGADELTVTLNENSKEYSARIIGADKATDLALIKIDAKNLSAITIANSDDVKVGEGVLASAPVSLFEPLGELLLDLSKGLGSDDRIVGVVLQGEYFAPP